MLRRTSFSMALEFNRKFWEEFIEMYRSFPCLWNMNSFEYKNKRLRYEAHLQLVKKCKELSPDANRDYVTKRINNLRSCFKREYRKVNEAKATGQDYTPCLWYYDLLLFTADQERNVEERDIIEEVNEEDYSNLDNTFDYKAHIPITEMPKVSRTNSPSNLPTYIPPLPTTNIIPTQTVRHPTISATSNTSATSRLDTRPSTSPSTSCRCLKNIWRRTKSNKNRKSELLQLAYSRLTVPNQTEDECDVIGKRFAFQLRKMDEHQRLIAEKIIYDVMYHGRFERLTESSGLRLGDEDRE